jgi:hypothetical protein
MVIRRLLQDHSTRSRTLMLPIVLLISLDESPQSVEGSAAAIEMFPPPWSLIHNIIGLTVGQSATTLLNNPGCPKRSAVYPDPALQRRPHTAMCMVLYVAVKCVVYTELTDQVPSRPIHRPIVPFLIMTDHRSRLPSPETVVDSFPGSYPASPTTLAQIRPCPT